MRVFGTPLLAAVVAAGAVACGPPPTPHVSEQIQTVKNEERPDKLVAKGKAFAELGDNSRAEQYLAAALDRGADPRVVLPLLVRVCIAEQRYRVAIDYAEPQLRRQPGDYRLRFVVASLYQSIGDVAAARRELQRVVDSKPDHADAHFAIGVLFRDEDKDPAAADPHFREYLRLKPDGPHAPEARAALLKPVEQAARTPDATPVTPTPGEWKEIPR